MSLEQHKKETKQLKSSNSVVVFHWMWKNIIYPPPLIKLWFSAVWLRNPWTRREGPLFVCKCCISATQYLPIGVLFTLPFNWKKSVWKIKQSNRKLFFIINVKNKLKKPFVFYSLMTARILFVVGRYFITIEFWPRVVLSCYVFESIEMQSSGNIDCFHNKEVCLIMGYSIIFAVCFCGRDRV